MVTPEGKTMSEEAFARDMNIQYTPSIFFYDPASGNPIEPVFRSEAYLKTLAEFKKLRDN